VGVVQCTARKGKRYKTDHQASIRYECIFMSETFFTPFFDGNNAVKDAFVIKMLLWQNVFFSPLQLFAKFEKAFIAVLTRLVSRIKITLSLKIQLKQHHISYVKIVYKHNMMR
jgi:hypothetical protein